MPDEQPCDDINWRLQNMRRGVVPDLTISTLYIDLETIPQGWRLWGRDVLAGRPPAVALDAVRKANSGKTAPANYGAEAAARWKVKLDTAVTADACKWYTRRSFDPKFGLILCAGYAFDAEDPEVLWPATADDAAEWGVLYRLSVLIEERKPQRIIAYNGTGFDFPFLWERSLGWGLPELARWFATPNYGAARALFLPHAPTALVDPCNLYSTTRESSNKLARVLDFLGIEVDDAIDGSQVFEAMVEGRSDQVREHAAADIDRLRRLWWRMAPAIGAKL